MLFLSNTSTVNFSGFRLGGIGCHEQARNAMTLQLRKDRQRCSNFTTLSHHCLQGIEGAPRCSVRKMLFLGGRHHKPAGAASINGYGGVCKSFWIAARIATRTRCRTRENTQASLTDSWKFSKERGAPT